MKEETLFKIEFQENCFIQASFVECLANKIIAVHMKTAISPETSSSFITILKILNSRNVNIMNSKSIVD